MACEGWLDLLRFQRHSFLNHLQVISGWIQLGKLDRARDYLQEVATRLEAQGELSLVQPPDLVLVLLQVAHLAETYDVEVLWDVKVPTGARFKVGQLRLLQRRLQAELEGAAERGVRLHVLLSEANGELLVQTHDIPGDQAGSC